jgi:integrase/recombinase XerD
MMEFKEKMVEDLRLREMSKATEDLYVRMVRKLEEFTGKRAEKTTQKDIRNYFLHIKKSGYSRTYFKIALCGVKFYMTYTLKRDWPVFKLIKPKDEKKLPVVLSRKEVRLMLSKIHVFRHYAFLSTVYSCGLRLREALNLEVKDIDSDRMLLHVRNGKGSRDRYVPLPDSTLRVLRKNWAEHRNPRFIFPATGRGGRGRPAAGSHMPACTPQLAMRKALKAAGIQKAAHIHTLRHSYATHLLESGVSIRIIQKYLGHALLKTTFIYAHLTEKSRTAAYSTLNNLMKGL